MVPRNQATSLGLKCAELPEAAIAEHLIRASGVGPFDPLGNGGSRVGEGSEVVLSGAFLLETAKEAFDDPVLSRGVERDELLPQPVVAQRQRSESSSRAGSVWPLRRGTGGPQGAEAGQASVLESPLGLVSGTT